MSEEKPIIYILRGDDREGVETRIKKFKASLGEKDMAEMNTTRLEGKSTRLNDLRTATLAIPFLTDRRMVILEDALQPFSGAAKKQERQDFLALLDSLPRTTALVLVVPDTQRYRNKEMRWDKLGGSHWLIQWAVGAGSKAIIVDCLLPSEKQMHGWIQKKVNEKNGRITSKGAEKLANFVGNNTQCAMLEIEKLLTYVNFERAIDEDDVEQLTTQNRQEGIFDLVDAIGSRNGKKALDLLQLLLEEMEFIRLFGMIVRQFRFLLQAREIMDEGGNEGDIAKLLHQKYFIAKKIRNQAALFNLPALEEIHQQLLEIDVNAKRGKMEGEVALDMLVARLATDLV